LSDLVLGQRGGLRKLGDKLQSRAFVLQVMCLRLAVIAHHARLDGPARRWRLRCGADEAELSFDGSDAPDARALYLLQEEAGHWQRAGVLKLRLRV
jgi:exopolyphosphatase/guanosine-5'-triphosphate,3'-diphosphate pyrophosphatase